MVKEINKEHISKIAEKDCQLGIKTFAEKIHLLRKNTKTTMADLSNMSGVPISTINDVEKVRYIPGFDIILKLGYALRLSKTEIFDLLQGQSLKIKQKDGALAMIKCGLASLHIDDNVISEIIDFIEFKSRKNLDPRCFYK